MCQISFSGGIICVLYSLIVGYICKSEDTSMDLYSLRSKTLSQPRNKRMLYYIIISESAIAIYTYVMVRVHSITHLPNSK